MTFPYQTSRDYDLLLRLMPAHRIVCFVDYRFHGDTRDEPPCRDVCATRYEAPNPNSRFQDAQQFPFIQVGARGIAYIGGWHMDPQKFQGYAEQLHLEFIVPPVNEAPLKRHGDALLHS